MWDTQLHHRLCVFFLKQTQNLLLEKKVLRGLKYTATVAINFLYASRNRKRFRIRGQACRLTKEFRLINLDTCFCNMSHLGYDISYVNNRDKDNKLHKFHFFYVYLCNLLIHNNKYNCSQDTRIGQDCSPLDQFSV